MSPNPLPPAKGTPLRKMSTLWSTSWGRGGSSLKDSGKSLCFQPWETGFVGRGQRKSPPPSCCKDWWGAASAHRGPLGVFQIRQRAHASGSSVFPASKYLPKQPKSE